MIDGMPSMPGPGNGGVDDREGVECDVADSWRRGPFFEALGEARKGSCDTEDGVGLSPSC